MAPTDTSSAEEQLPEVPSTGEVIARKYRVEGVVGSGGMGVVLSARHLQLGQAVAIKVLRVSYEDERRAEATSRFLREGQAAAALETEHVVRIYDVGTLDSGLPFMVMELLRGADLASLIERGPLPVETAVEYVLQACEAIAKAHAQGIVHRDLKPSNLFATQRSDGTALIKVLDFGISKTTRPKGEFDGDLTSTRSVLGSPFYMSPEQIRDARKADHRSDIWALGTILHELLAGSPAFEGDTLPGICAAIVADPPASLRGARADVPAALEAIVLACLEKDPAKRPQQVGQLMEALYPFSERAGSKALSRLDLTSGRAVAISSERRSLPGAETYPAITPGPLDAGSTLPSEDLIRRTPSSGRRVHVRTEDAVAVGKVSVPREKGPRAAALFVGVSLVVAFSAAGYGLWSGLGSPAASSASAVAAPLAAPIPPPQAIEAPKQAAQPVPAAEPVQTGAAAASASASAAPAPVSARTRAVSSKPARLKAKPAASASGVPAKPPETDIRLKR